MPDFKSVDRIVSEKVSARNAQIKQQFEEVPFVKIPGRTFPHANFKNALWLCFQAMEVESIITAGRGQIRTGKRKTLFKFLAPLQILEQHMHEWQEYQSIQSRLLEKVLTVEAGVEKVAGIASSVGRAFKATKKLPTGQRIKSLLTNAGLASYRIPKYKVDTPLSYTGSHRRQWQFEFNLADAEGGNTVVQAVKLLQKYSAPRSLGAIAIDFPHIFSIRTDPPGLLEVDYAAMLSVQPTWKAPYIDGYPTMCDLTIELRDMSPLFEKTIREGSLVNVTSTTQNPRNELSLADQRVIGKQQDIIRTNSAVNQSLNS
jgi:hypothetical protein